MEDVRRGSWHGGSSSRQEEVCGVERERRPATLLLQAVVR
jgi:hypothetical protein